MIRHLGLFAVAAVFEIGGCFAIWLWMRRGASLGVAALGIGCLIAFGMALARMDTPFAGRAYAAYGGVYILASLAWLWGIEGQRPSTADIVGVALCLTGALVILGFAMRASD